MSCQDEEIGKATKITRQDYLYEDQDNISHRFACDAKMKKSAKQRKYLLTFWDPQL